MMFQHPLHWVWMNWRRLPAGAALFLVGDFWIAQFEQNGYAFEKKLCWYEHDEPHVFDYLRANQSKLPYVPRPVVQQVAQGVESPETSWEVRRLILPMLSPWPCTENTRFRHHPHKYRTIQQTIAIGTYAP